MEKSNTRRRSSEMMEPVIAVSYLPARTDASRPDQGRMSWRISKSAYCFSSATTSLVKPEALPSFMISNGA